MNLERLKKYAEKKFGPEASKVIKHPQSVMKYLSSASEMLVKEKVLKGLEGSYEDLKTLLRLLKSWAKGHYKNVPWKTLWLSILAIIYFVSVIDLVPDFILGVGLLDDFTLIAWVLKSIKEDLDKFREFEDQAEKSPLTDHDIT